MLKAVIPRRALTSSWESADANWSGCGHLQTLQTSGCTVIFKNLFSELARALGDTNYERVNLPSAHLPSRNTRSRVGSRPPLPHPVSSVGRASARRQAVGIFPVFVQR